MKSLKPILRAVTLVLALSAAAFAQTSPAVSVTPPPLPNTGRGTYTATPTLDASDFAGRDVRGFGALLNGTGVSGAGNDDSAALTACLTTYSWCYIPSIVAGGTTHIRLATSKFFAGSTDAARRLSCAGSNIDGFTANSGMVSIDVDLPGWTGGPALIFGDLNDTAFNGITIDKSCHFRDISTSHNSPGAIALLNVSNTNIDAGFDNFILAPQATVSVAPSAVGSCTTSGGSVSSAATIFEKISAIGPGFGPGAVSAEVSATTVSMGCTSGSSCSCTPAAPATISTTAPAVQLWWGTATGAEFQLGMPYVCSAGTCAMTQNFNYGQAPTSASVVTSIPTSGSTPNVFDHSGGYGLYAQGSGSSNCGLHGDVCLSTGFVNQPQFSGTDCYQDNNCFDFYKKVAVPQVTKWHSNLATNGVHAMTTESTAVVTTCHLEGSGVGPQVNASGPVTFTDCILEASAAITGFNGVSLTRANFTGITCANAIAICITDDVNSSNNNWLGNSATAGTIAMQAGEAVLDSSNIYNTVPTVRYKTISATGSTGLGSATMATSPAGATTLWRINFYAVQIGAGTSCTGNTEIVGNVRFTDPNASSVATVPVAAFVITTNGTANTTIPPFASGTAPATIISGGGTYVFQSKANSQIAFSSTVTAGSGCSPAPTYALLPILELL